VEDFRLDHLPGVDVAGGDDHRQLSRCPTAASGDRAHQEDTEE